MLYRFFILTLVALSAVAFAPNTRAQVYVAYANSGVISEYDQTTGAVMNDMFVLGLKGPRSMCLTNGVLYVLQTDSGTISTHDPKTGSPVRADFIGGLNQPRTMTVANDTIYVSDSDWQTHQPRIGKYNAFTGAVINPALVTFAGSTMNGMTFPGMGPISLAVAGDKLAADGGDGNPNTPHLYDTTTGKLLERQDYSYLLSSADEMLVTGKWLWLAFSHPAPVGCLFKIDTRKPAAPFGMGIQHPLIRGIDNPSKMAISGDDLFIGTGEGTAIAKYNATSGAVINANFIPTQHDRLGGLAVVQRDLTADEVSADADYDWQQQVSHSSFVIMLHGGQLVTGACVVFALGMGVLVAILFRRKAAMEAALAEAPVDAATTEEGPLPVADASEDQTVAVDVPVARPPRFSTLAIVAAVLFGTTLVAVAVMGYLVMQPLVPIGTRDPQVEATLIGAWWYDNLDSITGHEQPTLLSLRVYPDHAEFSEGSGPHVQPGTWHDNGFWIKNADGSGETEAARIVDPVDIEVHVNAFIPTRTDVAVLYKKEGSAAERAAIAAKYPGPLTYPPPKGVVTFYMTEYDLDSLPWHADFAASGGDEPYSRGITWHYHSDDPKVPPLEVTLKNRHVVKIEGGYE